ncbi:LOW QUALITY PROTEIN: vicilin-like seed storage protein At2g18540 [Curcuma longa]|uniref:LOW QUALITY PROTEIN: vicilin-like seed storage protein At2g18540 n=1 Tax=Curcuma longa TaxID=136217 RepID=UPI003D9EE7F4
MMSSRALVLVGLTTILCTLAAAENGDDVHHLPKFTPLVTKESRGILALSEAGMITAVDVHDGYGDSYHLQFITMEPGSIFLPVLLRTDMAFYVHTGRGRVTFISEGGDEEEMDVVRGDVYRLEEGTTFYVKSHPDPARERLRIHAIFDTPEIDCCSPLGLSAGAYSNVSDLVRGFDDSVLQMGFGVSEETVRDIKSGRTPPPIVPSSGRNEMEEPNWKEEIMEALFGVRGTSDFLSKKKKMSGSKAFNFFKAEPDVKNENGWSTALTHKDLKVLKGSYFAPFMVNLMRGSMMGPHWNPRATEVAIVIEGQGVVQLICPGDASGKKIGAAARCRNTKFKVKEGDVFLVPRFHPMAQISYNNETLVFVGFSSATKNNHPQFLAGKRSVLRVIGADVLAAAFNVNSSVVEGLLASQDESIMLPCTSCADEMEAKMKREEEEKRAEEEARKKEEARKRRRRAKEEEEERKREEEEKEERRKRGRKEWKEGRREQ